MITPIKQLALDAALYKTQRDELAAALREVIESCRGSFAKDWARGLRCPNPSVDGPKFARAEALLEKLS